MTNVTVAKMSENDILAVCKVEQSCFSVPFKEEDLRSYLENPIWNLLVAKIDNTVVGYKCF